jgi:diguanylate cyclase (GGDEF)-like protein
MTRGGVRSELHDRAKFLLLAEDELQRSRRYERPLSCVVLGIDGFAEINEQHDDSVGDELLEYVGQIVVKDIRQFDLVGKYHADEFVCLLPETNRDAAREVAERLLEKLGRRTVSTRAGLIEITLSVGVAELRPDSPDLASLLSRAIAALEQAKRDGGARTRLWSGEPMTSAPEARIDGEGDGEGASP